MNESTAVIILYTIAATNDSIMFVGYPNPFLLVRILGYCLFQNLSQIFLSQQICMERQVVKLINASKTQSVVSGANEKLLSWET